MAKATDLAFDWSVDKVKDWWRTTPVEEAIARTAKQFSNYPELDHTLQTWVRNESVTDTLSKFAEGQMPSSGEPLRTAFTDSGFEPISGEASAEEVLIAFFEQLLAAHIRAERAPVSTMVLLKEQQKTNEAVALLSTKIGTQPLLEAGAGGKHGSNKSLTDNVATAKQLIADGQASASLKVLGVNEAKQDGATTKWDVYDLMATRANALVQLGQYSEAEVEYSAALRLMPERPNALANVARALLYLDRPTEAAEFAGKALAIEPTNPMALTVQAQILAAEKRFMEAQQLVEGLPVSAENDFFRGSLALWAGNPTEAVARMSSAVALAPKNPDIQVGLARAELAKVQEELQEGEHAPWGQISPTLKDQLGRITERLDTALESLRKRDDPHHLGLALMTRAALHAYLGNPKADADYDEAVSRGPVTKQLLEEASRYWLSTGKSAKARAQIEQFRKNNPPDGEVELLYARALHGNGRAKEAMTQLDHPLLAAPDLAHAVALLRLDAAIQLKDPAAAESVLAGLSSDERSEWDVVVRESDVLVLRGRREAAIELLREALPKVEPLARWRLRLALAEQFMELKRWADAAQTYGAVLTADAPEQLAYRYVACLYNAEDFEACKRYANEVRAARGVVPGVADVEAEMLTRLGYLEDADRVFEELVRVDSHSAKWNLKRAMIAVRRNDLEAAKRLLPLPEETLDLEAEDGMIAAQIHAMTGDALGSLDTAYRVLRANPDKASVHLKYVGVFFRVDTLLDDALRPAKAEPGTWVTIKSEDGTSVYELLGPGETANTLRQRASESAFAKAVSGKAVGDKFLLIDSPIGQKSAEIIEIRSKYVGAFQETMNGFNQAFPGEEGLQSVLIGPGPDIEPIRRSLAEKSRSVAGILENYGKLQIPISMLGHMLGKTDLDVWEFLVSGQSDLPLFVAAGSTEAQAEAKATADEEVPLVLELTSVVALSKMGLLEVLPKLGPKLYVAQSTLDQLTELRDARQLDLNREGAATLFAVEDQIYRQEINPEDLRRSLEVLTSLADWLRTNTVVSGVMPPPGSGRRELHEMMSHGAMDSVFLAQNVGGTLVSEDLRLRGLARGEFKVTGLAAMHLAQPLLDNELITVDQHDAAIVQMIVWRCEFVSVNARLILAAFKLDQYEAGFRYRAAIARLGDMGVSNEQVAGISSHVMKELSLLPVLEHRREAAMQVLLDMLAQRGWRRMEALLNKELPAACKLLPVSVDQIIRDIVAWKRARLLP